VKAERFLTVKKLTEEEEFQPKIKKTPLDSREYQTMLHKFHQNQTLATVSSSIPSHQTELMKLMKPGVEIVGLGNGRIKNQQLMETEDASFVAHSGTTDDDLFNLTSSRGGDQSEQPKARSTLVPHKKMFRSVVAARGEETNSLNDKTYLQIIDNLTYRYNINTNASNSSAINSNSNVTPSSSVASANGGLGGSGVVAAATTTVTMNESKDKSKIILVLPL
jgi:hypothetical protein